MKTSTSFFLIFLLTSGAVFGQNLVTNGDFSQAAAGWSSPIAYPISTGAITSYGGPPPSSNKVCVIGNYSPVRQMIAVQPSTGYVVQFHGSRQSSSTTIANPSSLRVLVTRDVDTFVDAVKGFSQATVPFIFSNETYYFITNPTTDSVALDFFSGSISNFAYVVIDDISVITGVSCSGTPTAGTASSSVSAVCPYAAFSIELNGGSLAPGIEFQWQSSPTGLNNWTNVGSNSSNLVVAGQVASTDYRCELTCLTSNLTNISNVVTIGQNPTLSCYCTPTVTAGCANDYMDNVSIFGESGSAIISIGTGCSANAYDDRTSYDSVVLAQAESYPVAITGMGNSGGVRVWVDFDDDGTFQSSEAIGNSGNTGGAAMPSYFSVLIPSTGTLGVHRMRVRFGATFAPSMTPCGTELYGETHDYSVRIVGPASCHKPTATTIVAGSITTSSASLSWTQTGSPGQWQVEYGSGNFVFGTGTRIVVTTNPYALTGLNANTLYKYYVRAICAPGDTSGWSAFKTFTTAVSCYAPSPATPTNLSSTSVLIQWSQPPGNPSQWQIQYGLQNFVFGAGTMISTTAQNYTFTGLVTGTTYKYYVRAICGPGDTSAWCSVHYFTPAGPVCPAPVAGLPVVISTTDVIVTWTQTGSPLAWQVAYDSTLSGIPGKGIRVMAGTNPFTLTGLSPGTLYKYSVRAICGPGDSSAWSSASNANQFMTQCNTYSPPYTEDFESTMGIYLPNCMNGVFTGRWYWVNSLYFPYTSTGLQPHTGIKYLRFTPSCFDSIYTAGVNLVAGNTYYFKCYYVTDGELGWGDLSAVVSSTPSSAGYISTIAHVTNPTNTVYQSLNGTFTPTFTGIYYFGIWDLFQPGWPPGDGLSIDDISVTSTPLAIKLSDIRARNVDRRNQVNWTTSMEEAGDQFVLEHSADGQHFNPLETIKATGVSKSYSYWHNDPVYGTNYYRMQLKDAGGGDSYSKTVTATCNEIVSAVIEVAPNPAKGSIEVTILDWEAGHSVLIVDGLGRKVLNIPSNNRKMTIDIGKLIPGDYYLKYSDSRLKPVKISLL